MRRESVITGPGPQTAGEDRFYAHLAIINMAKGYDTNTRLVSSGSG